MTDPEIPLTWEPGHECNMPECDEPGIAIVRYVISPEMMKYASNAVARDGSYEMKLCVEHLIEAVSGPVDRKPSEVELLTQRGITP